MRTVELVPFDASTRDVYDGILLDHLNKKKAGSNELFADASVNQHLFTSLRKAANHPLLLRRRYKSKDEKEHLAYQLFINGYFGRDATCTMDLVRKELAKFSDYDIHCAALDLIEDNPLCKVCFT